MLAAQQLRSITDGNVGNDRFKWVPARSIDAMAQSQSVPSFHMAVDSGTVVERDGYHQPDSRGPFRRPRSCGCDLTTDKGAYRDVGVDLSDGRLVHFYHQSPVVVEYPDGRLRLSSCGHRTSTTKERINRHLPRGYFVRQEDFEWYLEGPGGRVEFFDGMTVEPDE